MRSARPSIRIKPVLDEIVRRIVAVAQPEKVILFGSAARGDMNRHSDLDLLVVKDGVHQVRRPAWPFVNKRSRHGPRPVDQPIAAMTEGE